jgi:hypothetical protein
MAVADSRAYTLVPYQVVEILPAAAKASSYGSGYVLAPDLAVTAAHVVGTASEVRVRFGCAPGEPSLWCQADVAWRGRVVDIAIVRLREPPGLDLPVTPARIGDIVPTRESAIPFVAVGFPAHKEHRRSAGRVLRDSDHVRGEIPTLANAKTGRIDLLRDGAPLVLGEAWKGFSGAAVFAHGFFVGVAIEVEEDGRLVCERIGAALGVRPSVLAEYQEPADNVAQLRELFEGAGVPTEPARVIRRSTAALLPRSVRGPLLDRDEELDRLRAFARSNRGWELWLGEPWAGKSTLAAHFAADPPPDVDLVWHFVSARELRGGTQAYAQRVGDQLAALLDEPNIAAADVSLLDDLWSRAAVQAGLAGRQLLLLVDGLDENIDSVPIARALPLETPPHSHVLLFSRPHPDVRTLVDDGHPLRICDVVVLAPSPHASNIRDKARADLDGLLNEEGDAAKVVLGLLAIAGPMSMRELAEIGEIEGVSLDRITLENILERRAGRVVEPRAGDGTDPCYELAHRQLQEVLAEKVADRAARHLAAVHDWADGYAGRGWGDTDVPDYLVERYPRLLVAAEDAERLVKLSTASRSRFLRARTEDDQAAVTEHNAALALLLRMHIDTFDRLAPLALRRDVLRSGLRDAPVELALAWGALGRWRRAGNLASYLDEQERLRVALAAAAAGAYDVAREIGDTLSDEADDLRPVIAVAAATRGDVEFAQTLAATLEQPLARSQTLAAVAGQLAARQDMANSMLSEAVETASMLTDGGQRAIALASVAASSAVLGDGDARGLLDQAVEAAVPAGSAEAWLAIAAAGITVGQFARALVTIAWLPAEIAVAAFDGLVLGTAKAPAPPDRDAALAVLADAEACEGEGRHIALAWAATLAAGLGDAGLAGRLLDATPQDGDAESLTVLAEAAALADDFPRALRLVGAIDDPGVAATAILGALALRAAKGMPTGIAGPAWDALLAAVADLEDGPAVEALCRGMAVAASDPDPGAVDRLLEAAAARAHAMFNWEEMEQQGGVMGLAGLVGRVSGFMEPGPSRADVITAIAGAAAAAGRPRDGEKLALELRDGRARGRALATVVAATPAGGTAIDQQQLVEHAEAVLRGETDIRSKAVRAIAVALAERGDPERARNVAGGIRDPRTRGAAQADIVERIADRGELDLARAIAEELEDPGFRGPALCHVARAAHGHGNTVLAREVLDEVQAYVQGLDAWGRLNAGAYLSSTALHIGDYRRAVAIVNSDPRYAIGDLAAAARAAAEDGDGVLAAEILDRAEAILADGIETFAWALASLAQAVHAIDRRDRAHELMLQAKELAEHERGDSERARALGAVAAAACGTGDPSADETLAAAQQAAERLGSEYARNSALVDLVRALADGRAVDAAVAVARSIHAADDRVRALTATIGPAVAAKRQDLASALFEEADAAVMATSPAERTVLVLLDLADGAHEAGAAARAATLAEMAAEMAATHGWYVASVLDGVVTALERSERDPRPFLARACAGGPRDAPEIYGAIVRLEPGLAGALLGVLDEEAPPAGSSD